MSRIAIGSDHAGFDLKQHFVGVLQQHGHVVHDLGTHSTESCDYPPICAAVGRAVRDGDAELGIVIGGSGQGEQLAANKVHGVRCVMCSDCYSALMSREHNDANMLAMGARVVGSEVAKMIVRTFLTGQFNGDRHARRVGQLMALDAGETLQK